MFSCFCVFTMLIIRKKLLVCLFKLTHNSNNKKVSNGADLIWYNLYNWNSKPKGSKKSFKKQSFKPIYINLIPWGNTLFPKWITEHHLRYHPLYNTIRNFSKKDPLSVTSAAIQVFSNKFDQFETELAQQTITFPFSANELWTEPLSL